MSPGTVGLYLAAFGDNVTTMTHLLCTTCQAGYAAGEAYTCPVCGEDGILDAMYDYDAIRRVLTRDALAGRPQDIWRYRELLPIGPDAVLPSLSVGWTPITEAPRLARQLGLRSLCLKDDGRNPFQNKKPAPPRQGPPMNSEQPPRQGRADE